MAHGVNINEQPTGVKPPVSISAGLAVYIGTAPINSVDLTNVNKPVLCETESDFEAAFGALSDDFTSWTLHEAAKAHFSVYSVAPIVCVNILDPDNGYHVAHAVSESHQLVGGAVKLQVYGGPDEAMLGILIASISASKTGHGALELGVDYTVAFDSDGFVVFSVKAGGALGNSDVVLVTFDYLDPTGVSTDDVIGGQTGNSYSGLEVVQQVYPALRMVPGFLLAPKYSSIPAVAARMAVLCSSINGAFKAMALTDLSSNPSDIANYSLAPAWKTTNGFTSEFQINTWPKGKNGDDVYHASVILACVAGVTDASNSDQPYASPSNKPIVATAAVLDDGTEILLQRPEANVLNEQGIVTLLNGFNGWRLWGNRTGAYPSDTDPKDSFIPVRRMFSWIENTIILTTDVNVDDPVNRRLIDLVLDTIGSFLNGLIAVGALVDGKIEFRSSENSTTDLADGKVTWHVTLTPPSPGEQLDFTVEYDPTALAALFTS